MIGVAHSSLVSTFMNELLVPHKRVSISRGCRHQGLTTSTLLVLLGPSYYVISKKIVFAMSLILYDNYVTLILLS